MPKDIRAPGKMKRPPPSRRGIPRAIRSIRSLKGTRKTVFTKPIRGRRVILGYQLEDPLEARAVPESVNPGTILERIIYKRNLFLYGPPGPTTWTSQWGELAGGNVIGGIRLDFVYWLVRPPLALEPQGLFWHDPFMKYSDATRAFVVQSLGYRYAEIFEDEIMRLTDEQLDRRIQDLVGNRIALFSEIYLIEPSRIEGILRFGAPFKSESRRRI